MGIETRKKSDSAKKAAHSRTLRKCESKTETSSSGKTTERKRKLDGVDEEKIPHHNRREDMSNHSTYSELFSSVIYQYNRALGNVDHSKLSKFKKTVVINNLSRFKVCEMSSPFERRVTSIAWHPNYPEISVAGSKGGDLLLHSLKKGADDYFFPGVGAGGSVLGLKFCNTDPCTVYTASMTGKICKDDFHKQNSRVLLHLPLAFDNWFTCLGICYDRNFLMSGDCTGNSYLLKTSGEKVWKQKKLHSAKISYCEFNTNDPNIFVTSSIDRTVKLWDLRSLSENGLKSEPLLKLDFDKGVNSASFSPSNRLNLLVTDHHSQLRVYSSPCWNESLIITHPHRHFQHMTSIKAIWHPMEDIIIVGRYPDDNVQLGDQRTIDFYDGSTGELLYQIRSPSGNIVSLNAMNSTGDTIFSAAGHQVVYMQDENILNEARNNHGSDSESENAEVKLKMPKKKTKTSARSNKNISTKKSFKGTKSV